MYRAVIDTNVFVSGSTVSAGTPSQIINHWRNQAFVMVVSPPLIAEYEEVLLRPEVMKYTRLSAREVREYVADVIDRAYITQGVYEMTEITNDPDDNMILACALEGYVTYVVTGDTRSLLPLKQYQGINIVTPNHFLDLLDRNH